MMSVASRTKTKMFTTVVLGFVVALSILPTWANTTPGIDSLTTVRPVVSTSSKQDLSELRTRLKDRFSWVATEVTSLINWNTTVAEVFHEVPSVRTIDVTQWIWIETSDSNQNSFIDIQDDPYKNYIERLFAYDVLNPTQRFFPQNYFRTDDFIWLFNKLYKKTTGQSLSEQDILGITSSDGLMTKWMVQQMMYLGKNIDHFVIEGNPYDKLIRSEWAYYLVRIFDVPWLPSDPRNIDAIEDGYFIDVDGNPFESSIDILAGLGVLNTHTSKFYPDNYLRHYDFVVMLVNSYLVSKNQTLPSWSSFVQFSDVGSSAPYLPQLNYAAACGIIDRLTESESGNLYFEPNKFITKHDVYHILPKLLNIQFVHNDQEAENQKISRAELSKLLVDSFQLTPKEDSSLSSSWNELSTDDMSMLMKLKTLLSIL